MEARVLGTVEVGKDGTWIPIEGAKERALMGAGSHVSHQQLVEALWGDAPPHTADKMLQWHMSRLRRAIGGLGHADVMVAELESVDTEPPTARGRGWH